MANFTPDQLRQQQIAKVKQLLEQSTNHASTQNKRNSQRDKAITDPQNTTARAIKLSDIKEGASANDLLELTFNNGMILVDDRNLKQYANNVLTAQDKFKGGITPSEIIKWSNDIDRQRANEQIFFASLFSRKNDTFRYVTNAWVKSEDTVHYVTVQFLSYERSLTGTKEANAYQVKTNIVGKKVRFTCDCGRHRYFYNYIAGLGNYHLGQKEIRYPYIRNEYLTGIACKHVLRVMQHITSASGIQQILMYLKKDKAKLNTDERIKVEPVSKAEIQRQIDEQNKRIGKKRQQLPTQAEVNLQMSRDAQKAAKKQAQKEARKSKQQQAQSTQARIDAANKIISGLSDTEVMALMQQIMAQRGLK